MGIMPSRPRCPENPGPHLRTMTFHQPAPHAHGAGAGAEGRDFVHEIERAIYERRPAVLMVLYRVLGGRVGRSSSRCTRIVPRRRKGSSGHCGEAANLLILLMVRQAGLEPACLSALVPKTSVSTHSTTGARLTLRGYRISGFRGSGRCCRYRPRAFPLGRSGAAPDC